MTENQPENINIKVHRYNGKVKVKIEFDVTEDKWFTKDQISDRLIKNAPWLIRHLYSWEGFDQTYSIDLFVEALHNLGKGLLKWNNHVNSIQCGRRCLTASAMLKKAYNFEAWNDKSYHNWADNNKTWWRKLNKKGLSQLMTNHHKENAMAMDKAEYSDKMWKIIHKRQQKTKSTMKAEAWKYIHKHIESFWD